MMPPSFYASLDPGIAFAVRVLHASGIETCQSCQGGKGHAYAEPAIDFQDTVEGAAGFAALAALAAYGLPVSSVQKVWDVVNGDVSGFLWRVTFSRAMPEFATRAPIFVWGSQAR